MTGPSSTTTVTLVSVDLTGGWVGTLTDGSGASRQATWSAAQTGTTVSGPLFALVGPGNTPATFTLRGSLSGGQTPLALTLTLSSGNCSASGAGTSSSSLTPMTATIAMTFSPGCVPVFSTSATQTYQISLGRSF